VQIPTVDLIFELNVFERLEKSLVEKYVKNLITYIKPKGLIILFFLTVRARGTQFTKRLGDSAYVFWSNDEIEKLLKGIKLDIKEVKPWDVADIYICEYQ
jgi:hypothetical protein